MAMDRELKTALTALARGQACNDAAIAKLIKGQAGDDVAIATLIEGQASNDVAFGTLIERQTKLTERIDQIADQMTGAVSLITVLVDGEAKLNGRVDRFTAAVLRGFSEGAGRENVI